MALQDDWQADVGLLLWLSWLEGEGRQLDATQLQRAQARIAPWQKQVIKPLRQLRRRIKKDYPDRSETAEACRQAIKSAELHAEQRNLEELALLADSWFGTVPKLPLKAGGNLQLYADQLELPKALRQRLVQCLGSPSD